MICGVGTDIVAIERFRRFVADGNTALLDRLFTAGERAVCDARKGQSAAGYAARFAAKEAFLKALGTGLRGGITWHDMEVVNDPLGKPDLKLSGVAASRCRDAAAERVHLSLSHDGGNAVALVVLESL